MRTIEQMVQREVNCCMSSLVSTLAQGYGGAIKPHAMGELELKELCEQAAELAAPVPDYEEAARQAGWHKVGALCWRKLAGTHEEATTNSAEEACEFDGLEPVDSEVYEHWAVSPWLAEKLIEHGEKVDTDFAGMNVWARQTTGQQISADAVIERIYAAMMAPVE